MCVDGGGEGEGYEGSPTDTGNPSSGKKRGVLVEEGDGRRDPRQGDEGRSSGPENGSSSTVRD